MHFHSYTSQSQLATAFLSTVTRLISLSSQLLPGITIINFMVGNNLNLLIGMLLVAVADVLTIGNHTFLNKSR